MVICRQIYARKSLRMRRRCDNVALFFGEDIFIAFGAVLLMSNFLKENGDQQY